MLNSESESDLEIHKGERKRANKSWLLVVTIRKRLIKEMTFEEWVKIWQTEKEF